MKPALLLIITLVFSAFQSDNKILWKDTVKLTWDDFKGKPDDSSPYKANTETEITVEIKIKGNEAIVTLECCFLKDIAWTKTHDNANLLVHEQMHFNISEIGARKFRKKLKGKTFLAKTFQQELNNVRSETGKESKALQAEYDKETEHSINETVQKKWNKKIMEELKSLSAFSSPSITCVVK